MKNVRIDGAAVERVDPEMVLWQGRVVTTADDPARVEWKLDGLLQLPPNVTLRLTIDVVDGWPTEDA